MNRPYLYSGAMALALVFGVGIYSVTSQMQSPVLKESLSSVVPSGQQSVYRVSFQLDQIPKEAEAVTPFQLNGKLIAFRDVTGELITEWGDLPEFFVLGIPAPDSVVKAMIGTPMVTRRGPNGNLEHFIGQDFPGRYLGMQIGILDKTYIAKSQFQTEVENRRERDEFGHFNVQYTYRKNKGENSYRVERKWTQSLDNKVIVDTQDNTFTYSYNDQGQLQKVIGTLAFNYKNPQGSTDIYRYQLSLELEANEPVPDSKLVRAVRDLPHADLTRADVASRQALAEEQPQASSPILPTIDEALSRIDSFSPDSLGSEQQEIFQAIRFGVLAIPEEAAKVYVKILAIAGEDEVSEAKISLLFGALTATDLPEVADTFTAMAQNQCLSKICKMQAITSLNIHDNPSAANGKALIELAHKVKDEDVLAAAYLAAGSVASKAGGSASEISEALLKDLSLADSRNKAVLLKAMGNHGSRDYLSVLQSHAKSENPIERSSALYAMRNVPGEGVTQTLIAVLNIDGSDMANISALKALAQKTVTAPEQIELAEALGKTADQDVQAALSELLLNNFRANVAGSFEAIVKFKELALDSKLRAYLDDAVRDAQKTREKNLIYR